MLGGAAIKERIYLKALPGMRWNPEKTIFGNACRYRQVKIAVLMFLSLPSTSTQWNMQQIAALPLLATKTA